MKRLQILSTVLGFSLFLILSSCSKSGSGEEPLPDDQYYIKFKADGQVIIFTNDNLYSTVAGTFNVTDSSTDQYATGITASKSLNGNDAEVFTILLGTVDEAEPHVIYTNYTVNAPKKKADTFIGTYGIGEQVFGVVDEAFYELADQEVDKAEITFTEVTDETIKGTFSGTWNDFETDNNKLIKITEGEFFIPRF